jgi:hypothetical protein
MASALLLSTIPEWVPHTLFTGLKPTAHPTSHSNSLFKIIINLKFYVNNPHTINTVINSLL